MASIRKVVCISYETGKTVDRGGRSFPETKLLTVGSAFVDGESGRINGQFLAVPPQWNGEFLILDPLPKRDYPDEDPKPPRVVVRVRTLETRDPIREKGERRLAQLTSEQYRARFAKAKAELIRKNPFLAQNWNDAGGHGRMARSRLILELGTEPMDLMVLLPWLTSLYDRIGRTQNSAL